MTLGVGVGGLDAAGPPIMSVSASKPAVEVLAGRANEQPCPDIAPSLRESLAAIEQAERLVAALRALIDEANAASERLTNAIHDAAAANANGATVARMLQERLQLGTRALQAAQSQLHQLAKAESSLMAREQAIGELLRDAEKISQRALASTPRSSLEPEDARSQRMAKLAITMRRLADKLDGLTGRTADDASPASALLRGDESPRAEIVTRRPQPILRR